VLTGVFATRAVNDVADGDPVGLLEGGSVLSGQVVAVLVTTLFAVVASVIILSVLNATMGLRVSQENEIRGLDLSEHGEEGYIL
jgi:Amt family ammonium transporter